MHFYPPLPAENIWNLIEHLYPISDDMEIAPDFFDYFEAMATLLDKDKYVFKKRNAVFSFFLSDSLNMFFKILRSLFII